MLKFTRGGALSVLSVLTLLLPGVEARALPTAATIVVDGDDSDWELVLVNPENTSRDGDGSSLACLESSDLDCPVADASLDIAGFAWTHDETSFAFRIERHGGGDAAALIYIDADLDGRMQDNEPVLIVPLTSAAGDAIVSGRPYAATGGVGDRLVSVEGLADGWTLRGDFGAGSSPAGIARPLDLTGRVHEASVDRDQLGLSGVPAVGFHVSLVSSLDPPVVHDNMAGRGGGAGGTSYRAVELDGDRVAAGAPGGFAELTHDVHNAGNLPTRIRLEAISDTPLVIETWADLDGDGDAETWMAVDAEGDGDLGGVSDALAPEGDGDADGLLDLGVVAPGERRRFVLRVSLPVDSEGLRAEVSVRASPADEESLSSLVDDQVLSGAVTVEAAGDALGTPDHPAWLRFVVARHAGSGPVDLWAKTDEDWPLEVLEDALGTGRPEDAVAPVDSDGSGLPDLALAVGEARVVWLRLGVPGDAPLGMRESALLRGLEDGIPVAAATADITVAPPVQLVPDHRAEDGNALRGRTGEGIWFSHRLIHALENEDPVIVSAVSDLDWEVSLHDDPDGDGRPYDAVPLAASALVEVARNGGTRSLLVRVAVPDSVSVADASRITVTATPSAAAGRFATALDDAVASIVRIYEDAAHLVAISRVAACSPVHAQASGLPASSSDYRFAWRAPDGTAVRVQPASTDALGNCEDSWTPAPGERGEGFTVDIQEYDGTAWLTLDAATLAIDDLAEAEQPRVLGAPYHRTGSALAAEVEIRNASELLPIEDLELRWVVLAPDQSAHLMADGTFAPYSGLEWTSREFLPLDQGAVRELGLEVPAVNYPGEGEYELLIELGSRCGDTAVFASTGFTVIDDADGDGLARATELDAGTDPDDADSDDDGLPDGADGLGDADGDGLIDALDCDSDDDGLPDGLESGVWQAQADTDPAPGCFVADLWPVTTTDPDAADTDLGGIADGLEDQNANGRVDAGETDPNDGADDPACSADMAPEVEELELQALGGSLVLSWAAPTLDACSAVVILSGDAPDALVSDGVRRFGSAAEVPAEGSASFWLVAVDSTLMGLGETGR